MPRLSMNEMTTYRWSFEEDVARYSEAGIPAIGVWRQKLSDYGEEKGAELLAECGLAVSNLLWAGGFTGSDGRTYRESIDDAVDALRLAADLRCRCLIVYSGARHGHTHQHARRLMRGALEELLPLAKELKVTMAVEPMHAACADEWTFLTSLDEALDLIAAVDGSAVGLAFDSYHLCQDRGILGRIPNFASQIAIVHLGDGKRPPEAEQNRCRLGEGNLPLAEVIAALTDAGYDGDYDVELIGDEIMEHQYEELLIHSKQTFGAMLGAPT